MSAPDTDRVLALADTLDDAPWAETFDALERTPAALRALVAERQAVLALHFAAATNGPCAECALPWPCDTVRALGVTDNEGAPRG